MNELKHIEDLHQGWVAHMMIDELRGEVITTWTEEADGAFWDYVSRVATVDLGDDFEAWCLKATQREIADEAIKRIREFYKQAEQRA